MPFFKKCKKSKKEPKEILYDDYDAYKPEPKLCASTVVYKVEAHFMGRKAPSATVDGLQSVQKPLSEIYNACECDQILAKDIPRDVYLMVLASGVLALPVNPLDSPIWINMQQFRGCGAVKAVSTESGYGFVSIGSEEAAGSEFPGLFTLVSQRSGCVPLLDCYVFSCVSDESAIQLASYAQMMFEDRRGWSNEPNPPKFNFPNMHEPNALCDYEQEFQEFVNPEFYKKPPLQGFFYAPSSDVIRYFDIDSQTQRIIHDELVDDTHCLPSPIIITVPQAPAPVVEVINFPQQPMRQQKLDIIKIPQSTDSCDPDFLLIQDPVEPRGASKGHNLVTYGGYGNNVYQPQDGVPYLAHAQDYEPQQNIYIDSNVSGGYGKNAYQPQQNIYVDSNVPNYYCKPKKTHEIKKVDLDDWMRA